MSIFSLSHIIKNFPEDYPVHKKIVANIAFFFGALVIFPRKNLLTDENFREAKMILQRGDIVLLGNLRTLYGTVLGDAVTHTALYLGKGRFIHARAEGIIYISLQQIFTEYDTMSILRLPKETAHSHTIIRRVVRYTKGQYKKPYDFDFSTGDKAFFCSQLVNEAYKHAGYETGLQSIQEAQNIQQQIGQKVTQSVLSLHPAHFVRGNFEIIFLSHNLQMEEGKLKYTGD